MPFKPGTAGTLGRTSLCCTGLLSVLRNLASLVLGNEMPVYLPPPPTSEHSNNFNKKCQLFSKSWVSLLVENHGDRALGALRRQQCQGVQREKSLKMQLMEKHRSNQNDRNTLVFEWISVKVIHFAQGDQIILICFHLLLALL